MSQILYKSKLDVNKKCTANMKKKFKDHKKSQSFFFESKSVDSSLKLLKFKLNLKK